jgi:hypothetical protein
MLNLSTVPNQLKAIFILVLICVSGFTASAQKFPLKLSANHKYLTDSRNKPFLVKEISAWGLIQALSEKDEVVFIDSVKRRGFNTLMVSIISFDTRFAGGPPNWQGIPPFKTLGDFSTYNTAYFDHADRFLRVAQAKGMQVLLVPCYLGYKGDKNQGWWSQLLSPANSVAKSRAYGQFLGQRYKGFSNIIWIAGGDNKGDSTLNPHMDNIIGGIKEFDKRHLWTGHFESKQGTNWPSENPLYAQYIDIDGLYAFIEKDLGKDGPQYKTELAHYGKGKMIFQMDQSYEHDIPHVADNENPQWIRRKNYEGLLSGCAGTSFCPGQKDNPEYVFKNWQPLMNTGGMIEMRNCFNLFGSRAWQRLVPDTSSKIIADGRGESGSINYVCAAQTTDHNTYIAYLPLGGTVTLDLDALKIKMARAWWYDPRNGEALPIGTFAAHGTKKITAFTSEDWILVVDSADIPLPKPGK